MALKVAMYGTIPMPNRVRQGQTGPNWAKMGQNSAKHGQTGLNWQPNGFKQCQTESDRAKQCKTWPNSVKLGQLRPKWANRDSKWNETGQNRGETWRNGVKWGQTVPNGVSKPDRATKWDREKAIYFLSQEPPPKSVGGCSGFQEWHILRNDIYEHQRIYEQNFRSLGAQKEETLPVSPECPPRSLKGHSLFLNGVKMILDAKKKIFKH